MLDQVVDVERFRNLHGYAGALQKLLLGVLPPVGVLYVLDVPSYLRISVPQGQYLAVFVALVLGAVFLTIPPTARAARDRLPWYDLVLCGLGLTVGLYIAIRYDDLLVRIGQPTPERLVLAAIAVLLVLEANRRVAGWILVVIGSSFILYAAYAGLAPGGFAGSSIPWPVLLNYIYVDTNGLLGLPVAVTATVVLGFIFFGQVLVSTGAGEFFTEFAAATLGRFRGGAAKISVVASGLFGTISGSAVSNVVVDGVFTIRLMKQSGYKSPVAGAVEAVASTGGQLMPPVMGAAAFLIAQFLAIPYREVAIAAALPAILYYVTLYVQVDLEAARHGLHGAEKADMPSLRRVLRQSWMFALPFAALLGILFFAGLPEAKAGVAAAILGILLGFFQSKLRHGLGWILNCFEQTSRVLLEVGVIVAMAGFIIGAMQISGLAFILSNALINLAGGNVVVLLMLTAVVALILGMGMPTTAVYVLLAVLVAPALVQLGVPPLPAHLFVFYFGMLSMITPPVCLAAYAAAAIARASMWQTGFEAMRLAGIAYVVPFMFVASPALLLRGSLADIIPAAITAIVGASLMGVALVGFFTRDLDWLKRIVIGLCGVALVLPPNVGSAVHLGWAINLGGLAIAVPVLYYEWRRGKVLGAQTASAPAKSS
ncbi:MAG: TRAP transporter fused permease subunit [Chloroflexi bacterium]|nr:TRAP transporter fused permease subunit [Chloroflexota bacterium]